MKAVVKLPRIRDYPRRLWIDGEPWSVEMLPVVEYEGREVRGLTYMKDHRILVCSQQTPRERLKTFVHEVWHALQETYDFQMTHETIHDLEAPIVDLLIDNWPAVFAAMRR